MGQFDGKTAVVTGGSDGIGLATARRFAAEGAHVYITGRRQAKLDAAVKSIGPSATGVRGDVGVQADLDRLYEKIEADGRRIDALFANAGLGGSAPLGHITDEYLDSILDVNFKGTVFTVQKALPLMNDGAAVVLSGSIWSVKGVEGSGVYSATKAAIRSFGRTWANELRGRGIRVNTICAGTTDTAMFDIAFETPEQVQQVKDFLVTKIPMGRIGLPDDIADVVFFLSCDQSRFMTGTETFVDGGTTQI